MAEKKVLTILAGLAFCFVSFAPIFGMEHEEQEMKVNVADLRARVQMLQRKVERGEIDVDRLSDACVGFIKSMGDVIVFLQKPENQAVLDDQRDVVKELINIRGMMVNFVESDDLGAGVDLQIIVKGLDRFIQILTTVKGQPVAAFAAHGWRRICCKVLCELMVPVVLTVGLFFLFKDSIDTSSWDPNDNDFII